MAGEPPSKKVVRRVVKKAPAEPTIRYGRPAKARTPTAPKVAAPADKPPQPKRINPVTRARAAKENLTSGVKTSRNGLKSARDSVVTTSRRVGDKVQEGFWSTVYAVKDWWLPQLRPINASLVTGMLVGLLAVGLGYGALLLFSVIRGVAGGGGTWGSLTLVVVAFIAFAVGEWLLGQFGVGAARLTSLLGVIITIIAILGLFLSLADSVWAVLVVPAAASASFALSHWLMAAAESSAPESDS